MYLTITSDSTNETLMQRKLDDDEYLDCTIYATEYAACFDAELILGGVVPLGCGEFTVELAEHPGTAVCWSTQSYFTKPE